MKDKIIKVVEQSQAGHEESLESFSNLFLEMVGALKVVKKDKYLFPEIWEKLKEFKIG